MNQFYPEIDSIINSCIEGNQLAYKMLYKQYFSLAKKICIQYANNTEDAEELVDDTFMKVFKNLDKYDKNKPFVAWFRTIAVNTCINYYRANKTNYLTTIDEGPQIEETSENALHKIGYDELLKMVQQLKPNYRMVFLMYVVEGYSHKEIADMLNINEITCRTTLNKARVQLQQMINNI